MTATLSALPEALTTLDDVTAAPAGLWRRRLVGLVVVLVALGAALSLSLLVGANMQSPAATWHGLVRPDASESSLVVWTLRVPRTALAVLAGMAFAVAGALIQAITRNPLADPGILGVNAGAGFAVTLGAGFLGITGGVGFLWLAFAGALLATVLVYLIGAGGRAGMSPATLVLAGIALGAVLGGIATVLQLFDPETFRAVRRWGLGSVAVTDFSGLQLMLPYLLAALAISLVIAGPLNAIALGDDIATSLGAHVGRTRILGILAVTILAGGATALTGGIGFVGLMVPHVVRWFTGPDQRWVLTCSALAGPVLVLLADVLGRILVIPSELEVGLVTAVIGAPVLILLARRKTASGL